MCREGRVGGGSRRGRGRWKKKAWGIGCDCGSDYPSIPLSTKCFAHEATKDIFSPFLKLLMNAPFFVPSLI